MVPQHYICNSGIAAVMPTSSSDAPLDDARDGSIDRRTFGRHPDLVSIIGLGGFHLGMVKTAAESIRIIHAAIDAGVNFLDNAWEYHEGESEKRMGRAIKDRRDKVFLMTKVCTHGCDATVRLVSACAERFRRSLPQLSEAGAAGAGAAADCRHRDEEPWR